ncbi:uncharacterized protein LOC143851428 [Tasmannia lanceolata]|uniref:uncharacterized protein LOC143851428 n=1 Tax=Tasmannia lanceolata TaxID=3420 RepID=UPI004062F374
MLCRNLSQVDDEDPWSTPTPRKSRRRDSKNPYSTRGLDKFSAVLAELESRRESIIARMGSQDISLVRFVNSNSNDWIPIIVKIKSPKGANTEIVNDKNRPLDQKSKAIDQTPTGFSAPKEIMKSPTGFSREIAKSPTGFLAPKEIRPLDGRIKKRFSWDVKEGVDILRQRGYYSAVVLMLIMFCVVMFGRTFAILCTSIWWYLVPSVKSGNLNGRKSMKKDFGRRPSDKKLGVELRSVQSKKMGVMESSSPRQNVNGKKCWL